MIETGRGSEQQVREEGGRRVSYRSRSPSASSVHRGRRRRVSRGGDLSYNARGATDGGLALGLSSFSVGKLKSLKLWGRPMIQIIEI